METHEDGDKACRHWVGLEAKCRENNGNGVAMEIGPGGTYIYIARGQSHSGWRRGQWEPPGMRWVQRQDLWSRVVTDRYGMGTEAHGDGGGRTFG